jgi:Ice-binding-like
VLRILFKARFLGLAIPLLLAGMWPVAAQASGGLGLGTAAGFAVLADSTGLTCTDSSVSGQVGVSSSNTAITSTRCKMQVQVASGAYADFLTTYNNFKGLIASQGCPAAQTLTGTLAGVTLGPGVYCFPAAATLTGTLTLTGAGPWIFEVGTGGTGALTATNFTVLGGNPCNATWWVSQAVTLTTTAFQGTILAGADITLTGTSLAGRALATGAVTMTGSNTFGCTAAGTLAKRHCNQGVGNGPEGCDPGNSNQGNPARSNDELGGTPGDPGRQGGNGKQTTSITAQVIAGGSTNDKRTASVVAQVHTQASVPVKGNGDLGGHGRSMAKGKSK